MSLTKPNCNGYKRYINSTVGDTYEHRLVAEKIIERPLKKGEVVHHRDENRENNNPDNLLVFHTNADHNRFHKANKKELKQLDDKSWVCIKLKLKNKCNICNIFFESYDYDQKFCSEACSILNRRKAVRPPKNILRELVWSMPTTKVAEIYGVSDVAISKWCKSYEIEKPPRGYWAKQYSKVACLSIPSVF